MLGWGGGGALTKFCKKTAYFIRHKIFISGKNIDTRPLLLYVCFNNDYHNRTMFGTRFVTRRAIYINWGFSTGAQRTQRATRRSKGTPDITGGGGGDGNGTVGQ